MDLTHTFSVPASIDQTWAAFQDIESVAACFPGAQVTSVEGDSFEGTCKVKLGPIALVYNGSGHFVEKDEAAHRMVIEAKGKDKRGNGTAGAHVTAQLTEVDGSTEVSVVTDLNITGKPAQFGRGVMQDVSDKLLGLFVECLKDKVGDGVPAETAPPPEPPSDVTAPAAPAAPTEGAPAAATAEPVLPAPPGPAPSSAAPSSAAPSSAAAPSPTPPKAPQQAEVEALDLGATVLPVLAKAYWKQAVAALVLIAVVVAVVIAVV